MSTDQPILNGSSPALPMLMDTLMSSVDEAVRIDDLSQLSTFLLRMNVPAASGSLKTWLLQNESEVLRSRSLIRTLAVNEAAVRLFGAESAQQLVQHSNEHQKSASSPGYIAFVQALLSGEQEHTGTFFREDMHGQLLSGEVETRFIRTDERVFACHIIRQTRLVRELEHQLSRIRQLHSLAVNATDTGCWELSFTDDRLSMDATCHRLLGYNIGELPSRMDTYLPMVHPDDRESSREQIRRLYSGETAEYRIENRLQDKAGTWRWFLTHGRVMESRPDGQPTRMVGTILQIDVPKKTEELLRIEKQGFAMQAANHSLRDTLTVICQKLEEVWSGSRCSINLYDEATRTVQRSVAPSLPNEVTDLLQSFEIDSMESVCGDAIQQRGPVVVDDVMAVERFRHLHEMYRNLGVRRCWSTPAITPDQRLVATLCLLGDTPGPAGQEDLQLMEKFAQTLAILILQYEQDDQQRQLEQQLQVQDKFRSLGKLAGGIAHDFNNLLTVILGHGEILQMQLADNPAAVETTEKILHAVRIATSLSRQMLTFAGKATVQVQSVDMNEVAAEVCGLLRPGLREGITLQTRFSANAAVLRGDRGMLSQIIMNLVSNAAEAAHEEGGRISVAVTSEGISVPREELILQEELADTEDWICITVSDNGSGIPDNVREQIFDPFFTTRDSGKGLGLATVMGIVKRHQGAVHVSSQHGETVFRIFLPQELADDVAPNLYRPRDDARRRILLVDDDRAVRQSLTGMLQAAGFEVMSFAGGDHLLAFSAEILEDDMILMDQNMPVLKGSDTWQRLRDEGFENPVCFVTACGTEPLQRIIDDDESCCIVEKPVQISTICDAINMLTARTCPG